MKSIQAMYDKKVGLIENQRKLLDLADVEKRELTTEEVVAYDARDSDIEKIGKSIKREESQRANEAEMQRLQEIQPPGGPGDPEEVEDRGEMERRVASTIATFAKRGISEEDIAQHLGCPVRAITPPTQAQLNNFKHYLRTKEMRASTDPQNITTSADGGYAVADHWWAQLVSARLNQNIMRQLATVITTVSGTLNITIQDTPGVAAWYTESATIAVDKEDLTTTTLDAHKAARIVKITQELINDGVFDFVSYLMNQLSQSIGILEETAFVAGDNSSKPNGIFTAATTGVTAASGTAIVADELMELYHSIIRPYRSTATWLMKDATALLIRKLKDGNGQYLWQPGLQLGEPDVILGRPVQTTENAPAATSGLDSVLFGDIKSYWIADRKGFSMQRLDEKYAEFGQVGFLGAIRTDGELVDTAGVRVLTMQ